MDYSNQLIPIVDKMFERAREVIGNVKTPYTGNYVRLNQNKRYEDKFSASKKNISPNVPISNELKKIYANITYIPMGPENKIYYKECYDIHNISDDELIKYGIKTILKISEKPVNFSLNRVIEFKNLLMDVAKNIKNNIDDYYEYCKYVIVGPPGIGKTAFINYLFSVFYDELDQNKIILIRVDLNDITRFKDTLEERFCSKVMRVIAKRYFKKVINDKDFEDLFLDYFIPNYTDHSFFARYTDNKKLDIFHHYINMLHDLHARSFNEYNFSIRSLVKYDGDGKLYISTDDLCLFTKIMISFLQNILEWNFIFIYDGFDSVTFDEIQYEEYGRWLDHLEILTTVRDNSLYKAVYIVTMREYSYIRFAHNRKQHENSVGND